jgi:anaerobic selenocysteine-containing dehydrogenase
VVPLGAHSDERLEKTWRTKATDFPAIFGLFPPNVFPEEVLSGHPERLRAAIISSSNPLRSFADTTAWEKAFAALDLKVTIDIAMTETAELSDYVLPARSPYESYDSSFFSWNYPEVYFQMRQPILEPTPETKETGLILAEIADAAGLIPELPDYLRSAASKDRTTFTTALLTYIQRNPIHRKILPLIVAKARAGYTNSNNLDGLWGIFLASPGSFRKSTSRAGLPMPSALQAAGNLKKLVKACKAVVQCKSFIPLAILTPQIAHAEVLFETVLKSRSGLWLGKEGEDNMQQLKTKDKKIELYIEEMEEWISEITPEAEEHALMADANYPFILNAGRHTPQNANNLMRKPDWNKGRRSCTLAMNPADALQLGISDGEFVKIITAAASERIELEISDDVRPGQVLIPHGFGLKYRGVTHGIAVNRLTKNTHRDRLAATPIHRYVPCRVEKDDASQQSKS